jgi:hypothetical protein
MFSAPIAIALLMPTSLTGDVEQGAAAVALVDRGIGLQQARVLAQFVVGGAHRIERSIADSTPLVTVLAWPCGLPIAITVSPIIRSAERPISIGLTFSSFCSVICSSARSRLADEDSTWAGRVRPSRSLTTTSMPGAASRTSTTGATTCQLVITSPESSRITPEPWPSVTASRRVS